MSTIWEWMSIDGLSTLETLFLCFGVGLVFYLAYLEVRHIRRRRRHRRHRAAKRAQASAESTLPAKDADHFLSHSSR